MNNSLAFLLGHLLVFVVVIVVTHYLSRVPNLQQRIARALEFSDRPRQLIALRNLVEQAQEESAILDTTTKRLEEVRNAKAFTISPTALKSDVISGAIAAVVFYLGDSGLLALLSGPVKLFSQSELVWWFLGGPVAAITLTICHWIIHSGISDAQRPALALKHAKLGAWISGALAIGAIFAVYSARAADLSRVNWAENLVQAGMWALTVGFAIAGGFASSVAAIAYQEASLDRNLARNNARLEEYQRHIAAINGRVNELNNSPENSKPQPAAPTHPQGIGLPMTNAMNSDGEPRETEQRRGPNGGGV
jgi:small-conductance mechanosensitive channel